MKPQH